MDPPKRYVDAQTRLVDLFLAELDNLNDGSASIVNFNNTRQFDALLLHLESSFVPSNFSQVPSTNVLHILLTLAARCPASNWTHQSAHMDGIGASTDYMRQVNLEYDCTLFKSLLQERSLEILQNYLNIVAGCRSAAADRLYANLESVFVVFCPATSGSFFSKARSVSEIEDSPHEPVVEVISDSEGSDKLLEMGLAELVKLRYNLPMKSITSLSELGHKTSGMGETTLLFKDMPHLLAQATPEPEEAPKSRGKRPKREVNALLRLQVFDDFLLARKLDPSETYDLWSLLRWAFSCADNSTQYQQFLFNSAKTSAHVIYETYEGALRVMFDFLRIQRVRFRKNPNPRKSDLLTRLLHQLGRKEDWFDRAVEFVFTGLSLRSNDKPYPCYTREWLLVKHDPASQVAHCKSKVEYNDNKRSCTLRFQIMWLLYSQVDKDNLLENLVPKLAQLKLEYLVSFFDCYQGEPSTPLLSEFMVRLCGQSIAEMTSIVEDCFYQSTDSAHSKVQLISKLVGDDYIYSCLKEDDTYKSFEEFEAKWDKVIFLLGWLLNRALIDLQSGWSDSTQDKQALALVTLRVTTADDHKRTHYCEFIDSRSEDADVRVDDMNFTLSAREAAELKKRSSMSFKQMVEFKFYD